MPRVPGLSTGGADRVRTDDLRLAKPALSQLSYNPKGSSAPRFVGQGRIELPTSRLSGVRSNHLSYWPGGSVPGNWTVRIDAGLTKLTRRSAP
jgi:hypothetical protein